MSDKQLGSALITGASSGIGAVYAERLARRGYDLVLVARDQARLSSLAARLTSEYKVKVDVAPGDLTLAGDLARVAARIEADRGIRMLVNNAGMSLRSSLAETPAEEVAQLIALNIQATTILAGAAARAFPARASAAIINISSVLALAPEPFEGVYSGSKAYLLNLSLSLAQQLRDKGVHVQAVLPGATRTEIWARSGKDINAFPPDRVMSADDLVDAALLGLDRGEGVTIPSLANEDEWRALTAARLAMAPNLSRRDVAERYRR